MNIKTGYFKLFMALALILVLSILTPLKLITAEPGKSIAINLASYPLGFDPQTVLYDSEKILLNNLHEGLVVWDQGVLSPGMAAKWIVSADGKTYTFHLKDSYWSNGDQVTAFDFELSWKRILASEYVSSSRFLLDVIKNAYSYRVGNLKNADEIGVKALDKQVLQVVLEKPCSYFLNLLTFPAFLPVHSKYIKEKDQNYAPGFCSNGPFQIGEWEPRNHAVLVVNQFYQGERGNIKEIKVTFLPPNTGVTIYTAGMIDLLEEPPFSMFGQYGSDLVQASTMGTGFIYLNTRRPPLNNMVFRKALSLAINRDLLVARTLGYRGIPATGLIPPGIADSKSGTDFRQTGGALLDPADGEKCLEQLYTAGYPNEDGYPEIDILVVDSVVPLEMTKILAEMWEINLGLKVKIEAVSYDLFLELASTGRFYTARQGWTGDYPDPMTFLNLFHSQAAENFCSYKDPEYDYWLSVAQERMDTISRYRIYHLLEEKLISDLPIIPLYFNVKPYLVSRRLKGLTYSPQGFPLFRKARKVD
jgi:ABC-type oligopeptide transport system substrate-binding subunit